MMKHHTWNGTRTSNLMVRKLVKKRAVRRTRRRRVVRRRNYRRRTYRRRTYRRRRYRKRYQPKTVNIKYRTVHSIGDFINLPHRLSDPALIYYAYYPNSGGTNITIANARNLTNRLYSFVSTDYLANMDKYQFSRDQVTSVGGPPEQICFNAWNPYLDTSLLGPNYNVYASMYNYYKYRGIKVKWVPNVKTANLVQPRIVDIGITSESIKGTGRIVVGNLDVTSKTTGLTLTTNAQNGTITSTGSTSIDTLTKVPLNNESIEFNQSVPSIAKPSYESNYGYAPSLKMHVLFAKDGYWQFPMTTDPENGSNMFSDTVYKFKEYVQNMKTQNYKIYDMSKPFKFYCRPYCASKADEVTGYERVSLPDFGNGTIIYNGNSILKKKTRLPRQVVNYKSMVNLIDPDNKLKINQWQARLCDTNF